MKNKFKGMGVALITPFKQDNSVDFESLGKLIDYQIKGGADYMVVCGTTAETPTLTATERNEVIKFAISQIAGRVPIVLGLGGNNTMAIVETLKNDDFSGIDAILSVLALFAASSVLYNLPFQRYLYCL